VLITYIKNQGKADKSWPPLTTAWPYRVQA
jgi:hypothetical protein